MKYSELESETRDKLDTYLKRIAGEQSTKGREELEHALKSTLLANTGGVAVVSSLLAMNSSIVNILLVKISGVVFVLGILVILYFRYWLVSSLSESVINIKGFHISLINEKADASDDAIRNQLNEYEEKLKKFSTLFPTAIPVFIFLVGALLSCVALFV